MSLPEAGQRPLNTLLTFDIEVWCGSWKNLDGRFPGAFSRGVYGSSPAGNYALPKTLEILNTYDLKGVFFVEPLFATRFGLDPLAEIVGLIRDAGQEIQLHLHPEWQNEARVPLIAKHTEKRQHLFMYDIDEQTALIGHGLRLLKEAGAGPVNAFRAGSFACNAETFTALERNGIQYDSSLNITIDYSGRELPAEIRCQGIHRIGHTMEVPVSVFRNFNGNLRHMQVGACAYTEIVQALSSARVRGWSHCNIFSHNDEMLLQSGTKPDWTVVRRFEKLCQHLHFHPDDYPTLNFATGLFEEEFTGLALPTTSATACLVRNIEQGYRRVHEAMYRLRHYEAAERPPANTPSGDSAVTAGQNDLRKTPKV